MKSYSLPTRDLPLNDSWDVIVVGGGPAGCTAATAAAREGARTLLLEWSGSLGGMGTSALVPAFCPFSDKQSVIYRGLAERVLVSMKSRMAHVPTEQVDWVPIDAEALKRIYDELVYEHGAKVLFQTLIAAVERDDEGSVRYVVCASKAGLTAYQARVYVDCSGDADLAAWAGAQFHIGDDSQERNLMPATHCFLLTNVNEAAFRSGPFLHSSNPDSAIYAILESGEYPMIPDAHICCNIVGPGTVGFNAGHLWNVDNTRPETVSAALAQGRAIAAQYRDALARFYPDAFGNAFLVQTGSLMGVRETRRIVGDYVLTFEDYIARRSFADEICRNSYFIDVHPGVKNRFQDIQGMKEWENTTLRYQPGESHGIPYRCLTPSGLTNVLVAGRSISCEQIVQGSVRVMPVCLGMGEAAGAAAAQAVHLHNCDVHAVDTSQLRQRLVDAGAYLPAYA